MTSKRGKRTAAEVTAQDEDQDREQLTESEIVPGDLTAAAAALRQAAQDAEEEAARLRGEAATVVATSRIEADRVLAEGQAKALPLIADAGALELKAAELGGRNKHMEHAARQEALAEEHEARAEDLAADLGRVTEAIAGLDSKLAELGTGRERLEAALSTARDAADIEGIAAIRGQLDATSEAVAALTAQRETAQARAREIGKGIETEPGELLDALTAAETHRAALTRALDELFSDRPGAEHRRDLDNLKNTLQGNLARIADEARAEPPRRRFGFADAH